MFGIISSIVAGVLMSIQGVFNTRVTEKVGSVETLLIVQGSGFLLSLVLFALFRTGNLSKLPSVGKLYLTGGLIGVLIVYAVVLGMKSLGATCTVAVILVSQLLAAAAIDLLGLFGTSPVCFHGSKLAGIALMIGGIILFKLKG